VLDFVFGLFSAFSFSVSFLFSFLANYHRGNELHFLFPFPCFPEQLSPLFWVPSVAACCLLCFLFHLDSWGFPFSGYAVLRATHVCCFSMLPFSQYPLVLQFRLNLFGCPSLPVLIWFFLIFWFCLRATFVRPLISYITTAHLFVRWFSHFFFYFAATLSVLLPASCFGGRLITFRGLLVGCMTWSHPGWSSPMLFLLYVESGRPCWILTTCFAVNSWILSRAPVCHWSRFLPWIHILPADSLGARLFLLFGSAQLLTPIAGYISRFRLVRMCCMLRLLVLQLGIIVFQQLNVHTVPHRVIKFADWHGPVPFLFCAVFVKETSSDSTWLATICFVTIFVGMGVNRALACARCYFRSAPQKSACSFPRDCRAPQSFGSMPSVPTDISFPIIHIFSVFPFP